MLIDMEIFLAAALVAVSLLIRLGFGSVLGHTLAGMCINRSFRRKVGLITSGSAVIYLGLLY